MKKLEEMTDPRSCLNKAADDEPVFVLRAQDKIAASLVQEWADRAELHGAPAEKVADARALHAEMLAWPLRKYPD